MRARTLVAAGLIALAAAAPEARAADEKRTALTVYADLPARLRRIGAGGPNPRLQPAAPACTGVTACRGRASAAAQAA